MILTVLMPFSPERARPRALIHSRAYLARCSRRRGQPRTRRTG